MARRAVVLKPGEATPRQARGVRVLRPGPPRRDGRTLTDWIVGIAGMAVMVAAVTMFVWLPEEPPVLPQFEVSFEETIIEDTTVQDYVFAEGEVHDFTLPYDGINLYGITVTVEWTDDLAASRPDSFTLQIFDPAGNPVTANLTYLNPEPAQDGQPIPGYIPATAHRTLRAEIAPRPSTEVVTGLFEGESLEAATERVRADHELGGAGDWNLQVQLRLAGDCPDPATRDIHRIRACFMESPTGTDTGNAFQVVAVAFHRYDPVVVEL